MLASTDRRTNPSRCCVTTEGQRGEAAARRPLAAAATSHAEHSHVNRLTVVSRRCYLDSLTHHNVQIYVTRQAEYITHHDRQPRIKLSRMSLPHRVA